MHYTLWYTRSILPHVKAWCLLLNISMMLGEPLKILVLGRKKYIFLTPVSIRFFILRFSDEKSLVRVNRGLGLGGMHSIINIRLLLYSTCIPCLNNIGRSRFYIINPSPIQACPFGTSDVRDYSI